MSGDKDAIIVPGFLANGISVGIKEEGKKDLSLIFSEVPAKASAVFTTNAFKAAPVILDMERIREGIAQAIVVNSGNANAASGQEGYQDAVAMSKAVSGKLKISDDQVLVASTGIIGERLPIEKILGGVDRLVGGLHSQGIVSAEEGIMTTDKFPKIAYKKCQIGGREISVCGIAKGAGMIEPHMATMLSFIMTDIDIDYTCLNKVFKQVVNESFNAISVDGCMSTNDTVVIMANGVAGNKIVTSRSKGLNIFKKILRDIMIDLAQLIVFDGEGATKLIKIKVEGASSVNDAKKVAYCIANSNLVKAAFFGRDPNWGRIISAIGSSGIPVQPDLIDLYFDDASLFAHGRGCKVEEARLAEIMEGDTVEVTVKLGMGSRSFYLYTSDLTHDYVDLNSHYRS